jgi:IS5 family transposase
MPMAHYRSDRDWSSYNASLVGRGNVSLFLHHDILMRWDRAPVDGPCKRGRRTTYPDGVIEACLMLAQLFRLPLRQCEGFVQSFLDALGCGLRAPDYTTLSRRAARLDVDIGALRPLQKALANTDTPIVLAIDSTGLRLYNGSDWHRHRRKADGPKWQEKWRKLHIGIDTDSGQILVGHLSDAKDNDCKHGPGLIEACSNPIEAVAADRAYDTLKMRRACYERGARQLIPPKNNARRSKDNRNLKDYQHILSQRDEAIDLIDALYQNDMEKSVASSRWKKAVGYHVRSLVETTMSQIKAFSDDRLSARKETTRQTQALIKCKLINTLIAA